MDTTYGCLYPPCPIPRMIKMRAGNLINTIIYMINPGVNRRVIPLEWYQLNQGLPHIPTQCQRIPVKPVMGQEELCVVHVVEKVGQIIEINQCFQVGHGLFGALHVEGVVGGYVKSAWGPVYIENLLDFVFDMINSNIERMIERLRIIYVFQNEKNSSTTSRLCTRTQHGAAQGYPPLWIAQDSILSNGIKARILCSSLRFLLWWIY